MDTINVHTKAGTIGGTLFIFLLNILTGDIIRTVLFAALGATVSFFVSYFWKFCLKRWERCRKERSLPSSADDNGPGQTK